MNGFPAFFGRTDSTTETYANVVYNFMLAQAHNVQRLPKRSLERTYRLETRLAGLEVNGISAVFNKTFSRDPLKDAQAEQLRTATAILKATSGIISPDQAAQELGYGSAYDPTLLAAQPEAAKELRRLSRASLPEGIEPFTFRYDKASSSYKFVPERVEVIADTSAATLNV